MLVANDVDEMIVIDDCHELFYIHTYVSGVVMRRSMLTSTAAAGWLVQTTQYVCYGHCVTLHQVEVLRNTILVAAAPEQSAACSTAPAETYLQMHVSKRVATKHMAYLMDYYSAWSF